MVYYHRQTTIDTMATSNSPFPRWKQLIAQGIKDGMSQKQKGTLYYALSTVETTDASQKGGADKAPSQLPAPHVRMVVHRGFVNEQRSSSSETGVEPFDSRFGSNACLLTTTDIRAPKAQQIIAQSQAKASSSSGSQGAAGEICWWMEHASLQFRIAGTMHVLPRKDHPAAKAFNGSRLSPPASPEDGKDGEPFDWHKERSRIFEKLSPDLLASFTRPTPSGPHPHNERLKDGQGPGEGDPEEAKDDTNSPWTLKLPQPGQEENDEQKKLLEEAERNFALIVIDPETIDIVDLARDRRSLFTRIDPSKGANSDWKEMRLVP